MDAPEILVFDAGPLSHFARQQWLGTLKAVVGTRTALIPDVVLDELRIGAAQDSRIQAALDADWLERRDLSSGARSSPSPSSPHFSSAATATAERPASWHSPPQRAAPPSSTTVPPAARPKPTESATAALSRCSARPYGSDYSRSHWYPHSPTT
jgi:hypothetical protein